MKMTMHMDEATLAEVVVRRDRLTKLGKKGLGIGPGELKKAWADPFEKKATHAAIEPAKSANKGTR